MTKFMIELLLFIFICANVFYLIKNYVTYRNRAIIIYAIYLYAWHNNLVVTDIHDDMEDYDQTLFRLLDFGYERILPPEQFEKIKPYIRKYSEVKQDTNYAKCYSDMASKGYASMTNGCIGLLRRTKKCKHCPYFVIECGSKDYKGE